MDAREPLRFDRRDALRKLAVGGAVGGATWVAPKLERTSLVPDYAAAQTLPTCAPNRLPTIGMGAGVPTLQEPEGVDVDSLGNVWVADRRPSGKVQQFSSAGVFMRSIGLGAPSGVVVDASGDIYVVSVQRNVFGVRSSGGLFLNIHNSASSPPSPPFDYPQGIAVDPSGNIYVADSGNDLVYGFLPDGTQFLAIGGFAYPHKLAVDGMGRLYVSDFGGGTVYRYNVSPPSPTAILDTSFAPSIRWPSGVDVTADGATIYVLDDNAIPRLFRLDSTGAETLSVRLPGVGSVLDVAVGDVPGEVRIANTVAGIFHYECV